MEIIQEQDIIKKKQNTTNKIVIKSFEKDYLEQLDPIFFENKIVEFNFTSNNKNIYDVIIPFISKYHTSWKGLELHFRYQKKLFELKQYYNLAEAIKNMENIECFTLSFGGSIVSQYYAENNKASDYEWGRSTNGPNINYNNYKDLLEYISKIIYLSPNLKIFCLDFQGLSKDCIYMLPQLTSINHSLIQCSQLEQYTLSLNHCEMYENDKKTLSQFFSSFIFLKDLKHLKKFVLNIAEWDLSYENYLLLGKVISEYLTQDKQEFQEFEMDHSSKIEISSSDEPEFINEIQILIKSFSKFFQCNRKTLKKFYLSLCSYHCYDADVKEFSNIFESISQCESLQKLSLRIYSWKCNSLIIEENFYKAMRKLKNIYTLKLFHLCSFRTPLNELSPYYKYGTSFIELLEKRNFIIYKQILQLSQMRCIINHLYRSEILYQLSQLCNNIDLKMEWNKFSITI